MLNYMFCKANKKRYTSVGKPFVNEELLKTCFEKRDPIKPLREIIANRIHNNQENHTRT